MGSRVAHSTVFGIDLDMSRLNGAGRTRAVRRDYDDVPILMLTGSAAASDINDAHAAGIGAVIKKHFGIRATGADRRAGHGRRVPVRGDRSDLPQPRAGPVEIVETVCAAPAATARVDSSFGQLVVVRGAHIQSRRPRGIVGRYLSDGLMRRPRG